MQSWGLDFDLVRAREIASGALADRGVKVLAVPGGNARRKAQALGRQGRGNVRDFVASGGAYLGLCGGAGLALASREGLGICPWKRRVYRDRLRHLLSGHVRVSVESSSPLAPVGKDALLAPVWWPGQFAEKEDSGVEILARYQEPAKDFWVADMPLAAIPGRTLSDWEHLYGVRLNPEFMRGRPCVISGEHGRGRYVLSYVHLETPASPQANAWLFRILSELSGIPGQKPSPVPAWEVSVLPMRWNDPVLARARADLEEAIEVGLDHFLLFWRNPWLIGWRRGIPGGALNSLFSLVCQVMAQGETEAGCAFWDKRKEAFAGNMALFREGLTGYLLAERLAMAVQPSGRQGLFPKALKEQRETLFGPPMEPGGLYASLLADLEELAWRVLGESG